MEWCEYQLVVRPKEEALPQAYVGSMMRGAFGHALRQMACVMRRRDCTGCPVEASCVYTSLFEPRVPDDVDVMTRYNRAPPPFVLLAESPESASGSKIEFGFRLFGSSILHAPLVVHAFREAVSRGLGPRRLPYEISSIRQRESISNNSATVTDHLNLKPIRHSCPDPTSARLVWKMVTPLRITSNGSPMTPERFDLAGIAMGLLRRVGLMQSFYAPQEPLPDFAALKDSVQQFRLIDTELRWHGMLRRSNRQKATQSISGMMGKIEFDCSDSPEWYQYLAWAPILHLGKNTTMGLGRICAT